MRNYTVNLLAVIAVAGGLATGCGSTSKTPESGGKEVVVADTLDKDLGGDKIICRREHAVGSHVPIRICKTEAQLAREREATLNSVGMLRTMGGNEPAPAKSTPRN